MSQEFDRDVIIIGGGPAGSTVARYAAQGGGDVLVIDGRDPIGTPLQCGELVPTNDEMRRLCPDVPDMDDLFRTPKEAISRQSEKMHIVPPSGKPLIYDFDGYVLNRVAHDEFLVNLAKDAGADYLVKSRVKKVEGNNVILRNGDKYSAKIIVDAGGHNGLLGETTGVKSQRKYQFNSFLWMEILVKPLNYTSDLWRLVDMRGCSQKIVVLISAWGFREVSPRV